METLNYSNRFSIYPDNNYYKFVSVSKENTTETVSKLLGSLEIEASYQGDELVIVTATSGEEESLFTIGGIPLACVRIDDKWYVRTTTEDSGIYQGFFFKGKYFKAKLIGIVWYLII